MIFIMFIRLTKTVKKCFNSLNITQFKKNAIWDILDIPWSEICLFVYIASMILAMLYNEIIIPYKLTKMKKITFWRTSDDRKLRWIKHMYIKKMYKNLKTLFSLSTSVSPILVLIQKPWSGCINILWFIKALLNTKSLMSH